jgi:glycosyltransferase involved in cell wall biosynthesis
MENKTSRTEDFRYNLVFLFPEVLRPLKANFCREFEHLSKTCTGHIFTLSSERHANLKIGDFRLYSGKIQSSFVRTLIERLWIQVFVPLRLLWSGPRVDAVITWDPYASGIAGVILKLLLRTRLIVHAVGDYHQMDPTDDIVGDPHVQITLLKSLKKHMMRCVFQLAIWRADAVKVVNSDLEQFFKRRWPGKPLHRFPCFVAVDYFRSLEHRQGDYLLAIGHPFYRKGVDVAIRAFASLSKKHDNVKFRIMGYAPEEELKKYTRMGNGNRRIEFVRPGWIEEAGEQLRGCYALVHAARSDAAPRVLFEAMACKKPVVSTRTNGAIDYIEDGRTGLLSEIDDVEELAKNMDYLLTNPKVAEEMGIAGFEKVRREFSEASYINWVVSMLGAVVK